MLSFKRCQHEAAVELQLECAELISFCLGDSAENFVLEEHDLKGTG